MPPKTDRKPIWWTKERKQLALQLWTKMPRPSIDEMEKTLLATCKPTDKAKMTKITLNSVRAQVFGLAMEIFKKSDGTVLKRNTIADNYRIPYDVFADDRNGDGNWEKKRPPKVNEELVDAILLEEMDELKEKDIELIKTDYETPKIINSAVKLSDPFDEVEIPDMGDVNDIEETLPPNKPKSDKPLEVKSDTKKSITLSTIPKLSKVVDQLAVTQKAMSTNDELTRREIAELRADFNHKMGTIQHLLEQIVMALTGQEEKEAEDPLEEL